MMRRLILFFISAIIFSVMLAQDTISNSSTQWERLINAIVQVESGSNPKAVGGNSVGILQITPICLKECNNIRIQQKSPIRYILSDRYNPSKSIEMFNLIQDKYNPEHNLERAIRLWNGGPRYSIRGTDRYFRKVMSHLM